MFTIKVLKDKKTAIEVIKFLTSIDAFDQTWAPQEKQLVRKAVLTSLTVKNHRYWYVELNGIIIAALGVRENKYGSNGFEMDSDYMAVHKKYRQQGIASQLLAKMEAYVNSKNGRYIHILTCDIDSYSPAVNFYKKHGYKKVGQIKNYYVPGEGRIDLIKYL